MFAILLIVLFLIVVVYLFEQQTSFGSQPEGERLEKILLSKNYKNGSFQNLSPTKMMVENASYIQLFKMYIQKKTPTDPIDSLPIITPDFKNESENPEIIWFGHSSYLIQYQKFNILVDPVFSVRASPVQYAGSKAYYGTQVFNLDMLPYIDIVIISHDHYDHLDFETITRFKSRMVKFFVPLGVGAHLEYWEISPENITELDWWESVALGNFMTLTATPARHFSGRALTGRNQTLWSSYVLQMNHFKIFLGGDSGYDSHFIEIGKKFGAFDLAILECGQYNASWPYIHMMPEQTAQAAIDLKAKFLLPVHWSKFTLALHLWNEPIQRVVKKSHELHLLITTPQIGEKVIVGSKYPQSNWWDSVL